jgi:hypothetical protein
MEELNLFTYVAVGRFKSVRRAIQRKKVSETGTILPHRPFNNRSNRNGTRPLNELKKKAYVELSRITTRL